MRLHNNIRWMSTKSAYHGKLYELRIYSIKPANIKKAVELCKQAMPIRLSHSPALGYFFSEVGGLGEAVHIWQYENYCERAKIRSKLASDSDWLTKSEPMIAKFEKQENVCMRLFPWMNIRTDVTPGGFYFLYNFQFHQGIQAEEMSNSLRRFIEESRLSVLGAWKQELGGDSLRTAHAIFHSPSLDSSENPALAPAIAWGEMSKWTTNVHGRLLTPAAWSSWQ